MNKISAREIRVFVAGALAVGGLQALLSIPYEFTLSLSVVRMGSVIGADLLWGLALPIGIGIFLGRWSALFWAQIYLWVKFFMIISGTIIFWCYSHQIMGSADQKLASRLSHVEFLSFFGSVPVILVVGILLGLIFWSSSEKFRYEPDDE